ncbi:doublecortin domain-containing protein 2C-like isoform X2 [Tubulanus polymorphus]|uniref:doublecortin domain-containing protein 2C-like isoform X2 n=1 Tax=Tubulanus polymorphus TaxID=672921 RepID=UPI003DA6B435
MATDAGGGPHAAAGISTEHQPQKNGDGVKSVWIYRNGDSFFQARRFVLNPKQVRTYDCFLSQLTKTLNPSFGCVRKLYTPVGGHRVPQDIGTLQPDKQYVAAGLERFKKLAYLNIHSPVFPKLPKTHKLQEITPVKHSRIQASGRIRKLKNESCTIFVYTNGDTLRHASRILLQERERHSWESIFSAVSERVSLRTGAIHGLYTVDGELVTNCSVLKNGECYVAVGKEQFRPLPYGQPMKPINTSPRIDRKRYDALKYDRVAMLQQKRMRKNRTGGSTSSGESSTKSGEPPKKKTNRTSKKKAATTTTTNKKDDVFHAKNEKKQTKAKEVDYDRDDSGVYKAKTRDEDKAEEVEETNDTQVELPIDQVEAEEVKDEEEIQDVPADKELTKKPSEDEAKKLSPSPPPKSQTPPQNGMATPPPRREQSATPEVGKRSATPAERSASKQDRQATPAQRSASRQDRQATPAERPASEHDRQATPPIENKERDSSTSIADEVNNEEDEGEKPADDESDEAKSNAAATKIQAGYRGYNTRKNIKKLKEEQASAK